MIASVQVDESLDFLTGSEFVVGDDIAEDGLEARPTRRNVRLRRFKKCAWRKGWQVSLWKLFL